MTAKTTILTTSFMLPFLVSFGVASEPVVPARENGELVLFDAAKHGPEVFRNYTASWIEGSNLVPVMRQVTKNGEKFIEISYEKERGLAISLIRFESLPVSRRGMRYNGIRLVIDYDKDDYSPGATLPLSDRRTCNWERCIWVLLDGRWPSTSRLKKKQ